MLSTCSDYFLNIFEYTPCVNPVIVINNVSCSDLESLLDFMYLGETNVRESDIQSVMKTAECLRIRGLSIFEADPQNKPANTSFSSLPPRSTVANNARKKRKTDPPRFPTVQRQTSNSPLSHPAPSRPTPRQRNPTIPQQRPATLPSQRSRPFGAVTRPQLPTVQQLPGPFQTTESNSQQLPPPSQSPSLPQPHPQQISNPTSILASHILNSQPKNDHAVSRRESPKSTPVPSPFLISPVPSPSHTPPFNVMSPPPTESCSPIPSTYSNFEVSSVSGAADFTQAQNANLSESLLNYGATNELVNTEDQNFNMIQAAQDNIFIPKSELTESLGVASSSAMEMHDSQTEVKTEESAYPEDIRPSISQNQATEEIPTISGLVGLEHKIMKEDILLENSDDVKEQMGITTSADGCVGIPELLDGLVDMRPLYAKVHQSEEIESQKSNVSRYLLYVFLFIYFSTLT